MNDSSNNRTFAGYFADAFQQRLKESDRFGIRESIRSVKESGKKAIAETAADMAINETEALVTQLKEDSKDIIKETAEKLSPDTQDSWNIIRENIAPQGGFFRTIFARLIWIGAKVTSFVGALVVDQWTGKDEKAVNKDNLDTIFAWLLGWMFKKPKVEENSEQRSPLTQRPKGIPKTWLNSAPIPVS